jgi:hypothetical protein
MAIRLPCPAPISNESADTGLVTLIYLIRGSPSLTSLSFVQEEKTLAASKAVTMNSVDLLNDFI